LPQQSPLDDAEKRRVESTTKPVFSYENSGFEDHGI
jgi:hypothetical protein